MPRGNTTLRDRIRATLKAQGGPCWICGYVFTYDEPYLHPRSFTVDHVIPIARGGVDSIENCAPACRACNRAKSDRLPGELAGARRTGPAPLTTTRRWW